MDSPRLTDPVFVSRAAEMVIAHGDQHDFSGTELAADLNLSREQTHRKLKKNTNLSTGKFICYIRLLKAYHYIQSTSLTISEVAYKVGFESPAYFTKCFKDAYKINPCDLKKHGALVLPLESEIAVFSRMSQVLTPLTTAGVVPVFKGVVKELIKIKQKKKFKWLVPILLSVITCILLSANFLKNRKSVFVLEGAKIGRVGIIPFNNQTSDSLYEPLGDIVSSWLSSQLDELEDVKIVPYLTMKAYLPYLGILPDDPLGRPTLSEVVYANYYISGNYYLRGNNLVLEARLADAETQEVIYSAPLITGSRDSIMQVVEKLRLKIAGMLTNLDEVKMGKLNPPNYAAYVHYLQGLSELESGIYPREALAHFEEASRLEPDFVMPRIFLTWFYKDNRLDSIIQVLQKMENITSYERTVCDEIHQLYLRKYQESLQISLNMLKKYPQDYYFNMLAGHRAKSLFKPSLSLEIFSRLEDPFPDDFGKIWHYYKVWNVTESFLMLREHEKALKYLNSIPEDLHNTALPYLYVVTYCRLNKSTEELEEMLNSYCEKNKNWCVDYYAAAAYEYRLESKDAEVLYFAEKAMQKMQDMPDQKGNLFDMVDVLYLAGDYANAKNHLKRELHRDPNNIQLKIYLAYAETSLGNTVAGEKLFEAVNGDEIFWQRNEFPYHIAYLKARLYALTGEDEKAIAHLKTAMEKGQFRHHWDYERDIFLKNLHNNPEFQKMVVPRD